MNENDMRFISNSFKITTSTLIFIIVLVNTIGVAFNALMMVALFSGMME